MVDPFETLMTEVGEALDEDMTLDSNSTVSLLVDDEIVVQLESDPQDEAILITCILSELPPGSFRRNILKDALKSNGLYENRPGILSYLEPNNQLILFHKAQIQNAQADTIVEVLLSLVHRAKLWKHAIDEGRTCPHDASEIPTPATQRRPGMFGFTG